MGRAEDIFEKIKREGISAIDDFILQRQSEELFLDFKRSADSGEGTKLHENDRHNLAKMLSAFGNSSGGVIVWGIDCSHNPKDNADLPRSKCVIKDVKRFVGRLEGAVSGCTLPAHSKVVHYPVELINSGDGFVATLIPESYLAPHQNRFDSCYYIRVGSNCERAPHGVIAGMFGKKPTPNLILTFVKNPALVCGPMVPVVSGSSHTVEFPLGFIIAHQTPAIVRDLYFSLQCFKPGPNCTMSWLAGSSESWEEHVPSGLRYSVTTDDRFKLPPETHTRPGMLHVTLAPPFESDFGFECWWGCSNGPVKNHRHTTCPKVLNDAWEKYLLSSKGRKLGPEFIDMILPLDWGYIELGISGALFTE